MIIAAGFIFCVFACLDRSFAADNNNSNNSCCCLIKQNNFLVDVCRLLFVIVNTIRGLVQSKKEQKQEENRI